MTEPLPFFNDSDVRRVLCVVAHPDDMEYGGSAAVARWTSRGIDVSYLLLTAGEAGMRSKDPAEVAALRAEEQRRACAVVGVDDLTILDFPDGTLEPSLEVRQAIAQRIREVTPDLIVTQVWDLKVAWGLNHADHRAAGIATVDAIRDADNPWVFRDHPQMRELAPWGAEWLMIVGGEPTHLIDVSGEPLDQAVASLQAHEGYLAELGGDMDVRGMLEEMTTVTDTCDDHGSQVTHALGVALYRMG